MSRPLRFQRAAVWPLALLFALGLAACGGDDTGSQSGASDPFPAHAPKGVQTPASSVTGTATLNKGVLPYDADWWANKTVDEDWSIHFAASDTVSQLVLKPGAVLAVPGVTGGDIRVVNGNETSGNKVMVTTSPATLKDYFQDADLKLSIGGDAAKSDLVDPWVDVDLSGKTLSDKSGDSWEMKLEIDKGRIAGNPRFDLDVVISWGDLHLFQLTSAGFFVLQADLKLSGKTSKSIDKSVELPLVEKEIVALVGGVPVWVTPYVKLEVKGEAKLSAEGEVTAGFRSTLPGSFNLKWTLEDTPHWSSSTTGKVTFKPRPVKVAKAEVAGEAELTVTAYVGVKLYKRIGVEIEAAASSKAEVKVAEGCTYELSAKAEGKVSAKLDGFGPIEDKNESWSLFELSKTLTSGSCGGAVVDAGAADGVAQDSGAVDSGPADTGASDTSASDGGTPDVGQPTGGSGCKKTQSGCDQEYLTCCTSCCVSYSSPWSKDCRDKCNAYGSGTPQSGACQMSCYVASLDHIKGCLAASGCKVAQFGNQYLDDGQLGAAKACYAQTAKCWANGDPDAFPPFSETCNNAHQSCLKGALGG